MTGSRFYGSVGSARRAAVLPGNSENVIERQERQILVDRVNVLVVGVSIPRYPARHHVLNPPFRSSARRAVDQAVPNGEEVARRCLRQEGARPGGANEKLRLHSATLLIA